MKINNSSARTLGPGKASSHQNIHCTAGLKVGPNAPRNEEREKQYSWEGQDLSPGERQKPEPPFIWKRIPLYFWTSGRIADSAKNGLEIDALSRPKTHFWAGAVPTRMPSSGSKVHYYSWSKSNTACMLQRKMRGKALEMINFQACTYQSQNVRVFVRGKELLTHSTLSQIVEMLFQGNIGAWKAKRHKKVSLRTGQHISRYTGIKIKHTCKRHLLTYIEVWRHDNTIITYESTDSGFTEMKWKLPWASWKPEPTYTSDTSTHSAVYKSWVEVLMPRSKLKRQQASKGPSRYLSGTNTHVLFGTGVGLVLCRGHGTAPSKLAGPRNTRLE